VAPARGALSSARRTSPGSPVASFDRERTRFSDDYYQSDKDWMDVEGALEFTIGPYETYEDELFGLKASFGRSF
jgi:hypothetical protein